MGDNEGKKPPPPPPPPPSKGKAGAPPPPPPPGGKAKPGGPPSPPGGGPVAVAALDLTTIPAAQRLEWVTSSKGLNIDKLKFKPRYPQDPTVLKKMGVNIDLANANIPDKNLDKHGQAAKECVLNSVNNYFKAIFTMDDAIIKDVLQEMQANSKKWKNSEEALNNWEEYLRKKIPQLNLASRSIELAKKNDPEYQQHAAASQAIISEYEAAFAKLQGLDPEHADYDRLYKVCETAISNLADAKKNKIRNLTAVIQETKDKLTTQINTMFSERTNVENAIEKIIADIDKNQLLIKNPALASPRKLQQAADNITALEKTKAEKEKILNELLKRHEQDPTVDELNKKLSAQLDTQLSLDAMRQLYDAPASWRKFNLTGGANRPVAAAGDVDMTGMTGQPDKRQVDLNFLSISQWVKLREFFQTENDYFSIDTQEGRIALMRHIASVLQLTNCNFNMLMDIADGRIYRTTENAPTLAMKLFTENVEIDENIKPNYQGLLAKQASFKATDINKKQGIIIVKPLSDKAKDFEYTRKLDDTGLKYLSQPQQHNVASFFARQDKEFVGEDGSIDLNNLHARINQVLNSTNLTFENLINIASGYLRRIPGKSAPNENWKFLLAKEGNSELIGPQQQHADPEQFIKQRQDYLAEQARQEQARREAEQQQRAQQNAEAKAARAAEVENLFTQLQSQFEEKIHLKPGDAWEIFVPWFHAQLQDIPDTMTKNMLIDKLKQMATDNGYDVSPLKILGVQVQVPTGASTTASTVPQTTTDSRTGTPAPPPIRTSIPRPQSTQPDLTGIGISALSVVEKLNAFDPSMWEGVKDPAQNIRQLKTEYNALRFLIMPIAVNMNDFLNSATLDLDSGLRWRQKSANKNFSQNKEILNNLNEIQVLTALFVNTSHFNNITRNDRLCILRGKVLNLIDELQVKFKVDSLRKTNIGSVYAQLLDSLNSLKHPSNQNANNDQYCKVQCNRFMQTITPSQKDEIQDSINSFARTDTSKLSKP